jgi:DNA-binding MarR family transcriptional regulator
VNAPEHPTADPAIDQTVAPAVDPTGDPTSESYWRPLRLLQEAMGRDLTRIYTDEQIHGLKPTYVLELLRLNALGPMTITELAESVGHTHSALSQKVAAMRRAGWVETVPGEDARTKKATLTDKSRAIVGRLAAEWRATEAACADIDAELAVPLSRFVAELEQALARRGFHDRIAEKLAADPEWGGRG